MGCTDGQSIYDIPGAYEAWQQAVQKRRAEACNCTHSPEHHGWERIGSGPCRYCACHEFSLT